MACTEVALTVYTKSGTTYFIIYVGFYTNTYALIIPSADCDADGNCNIVNFSPGTYLDCSDYRFFWVSWDLAGNVALGTDYAVGVNTIIAITNGLTEEAVYAVFEITDLYGGSIYLSVDNDPVFLNPAPDGSTEITLTETSTVGTVLYTIATSDSDGDTVTGYILDDSTSFVFSGNDLTNLIALDYETECSYHVKITIHDGANMVNTTLTINLVNAFDEPPNVDAMSVSLPEELPIGSFIDSGLTVSDSDEGDQLTYSLSGTHAGYFEVNSDGRLKVAARIDFDPPNSITQLDQLTLTVTDLGSNTNSTTLTFTVKDVNDMKPLFSQPVYNAAVTEGAGTVSLLQLTITDADSGVNADFDVTMDGDDPSDPAFTFDPSTLQLSVDANKLDYESLAGTAFTSTLTFVATDKATEYEPRTGTTVAVIKVDPENEHSPVWTTQPADTSVSETAPGGSLVDTYTATDDDFTEHGDVTYSIISITSASGSDGSGMLSLDSKSGELRVTSPLDADTSTGGDPSYDVVIQASDCCSKTVQASVTITVTGENDNAPAFTQQIYYSELVEDVASGEVVAEATDADGDTLTFTLSGEGSDMFYYAPPKVYLNSPLDYETQRYYFLTVRASDGVHETDAAVNINVTDIIDEPTVITVHNPLSIVEELPVGTPLGGVYDVTEKDKDDVLIYSLEGTESSYFNIDSISGLITVAQRIDRDTGLTAITDVTLKVTDVAAMTFSQPLTFDVVDINDNSPQFTSDVIFVNLMENTGIDALVKTFSVTDDDDGDNSNVVVSIVSGDDANPNEKFRLNGLDLLTTFTAVDYEALSSTNFLYTLTVQAVDQPTTEAAKAAVAVVVVTVLPVNEHSPVWATDPADTTLPETSSPGTVIATYTATDDDLSKDGNVTYELSSILDNLGTDGSGTFTLDSGNGEFALAANLDYDTGVTYYDVTVKAIDDGTTVLSVEKTIRISVGAENDNPPVFSKSAYDGEIAEDVATGTSVLGFVVTDVDGDTNTVTVIGGDGTFTIDGADIKTAATLDYEMRRCYSFRIRASDGVHETEVAVTINVTNIIDENPVLNVNTPVSLLEELLLGTPLGGVHDVTDIDDDDTLTYSLEGTGSSYFSIDPSTGVMTVAQRMDREAGLTSITDVTLKVTDAGGNIASEALTFDIVDINDNSPTFAVDVFFVNVTENAPNGQVFFTISCTDADDGDNAAVSVTIKSGDVSPARFSLSGFDLVSTGQPVDYEDPLVPGNMYTLSIQAEDAPLQGDPHVAKATVVVMVLPENEFTPVFTAPTATDVTISETSQTSSVVETFSATDDDNGEDGRVVYEITTVLPENEFTPVFTAPTATDVTISETSQTSSVVETFSATDDDNGEDGRVVYEITTVIDPSGADASTKFLIEEATGVLRVAEGLDVDVMTGGVAHYDVTVMATDKGLTPKSTTQSLRVTLQNENDLTPEFIDFTYFVNVPEDTNVNDVILTFSVRDGDGDTVTASLVDGETSLFSVAGTDVALALAQMLDYETSSSHSIVISSKMFANLVSCCRSISDGVHSANQTLVVRVTDVIDETPNVVTFTPVFVTEELPVGTPVDGLYHMTDLDTGDSWTFTLQGTDSSFFTINATSGSVKLAQRIDLEALAGDNVLDQLTLTVTDQAGLQATASLSVEIQDINDAYPTFAESVYKVNISESSSTEVLVDLVATDADSGTNGAITMQITDGDDPGASKFQLSGTQLSALGADLDYEALKDTQYMYILTVSATDSPSGEAPKTGVTLVVVSILPVNEHAPVWSAALSVSGGALPDLNMNENVTVGSGLLTLQATDGDHGVDGDVTYTITSAVTNTGTSAIDLFALNPVTGTLRTAGNLDRDITTGQMYYDLTLTARDGGDPYKETSATLKIILDNVNDNAPVFTSADYKLDVAETTPVGTVIHTFAAATDVDGDAITYSIVGGHSDVFGTTGMTVETLRQLDYEQERCYSLVIQ
ncbi:protocadherin Fat 4-like [Haliotis rubra]|uniref:protocadherin Fat 4-like n=1 Tax=Haliotis rubra TaxID=36100 RepID=UPI001EE62A48|nr:protocadherin Fat 4-like [Haliotis rubra]